MKKTTIIVHQKYLTNVIKKLHELGLMEIIDIHKNGSEEFKDTVKASVHPETSLCINYELRLSRLIGILRKISPKEKGIKNILNPKITEIIDIEDYSLDEIYSQIEYTLSDIEKKILINEKRILESDDKIENLQIKIDFLRYIEDFEINLSDVGKSKYLVLKIGKTNDLNKLINKIEKLEKTVIYSKQLGKGKNIEWGLIIVSYLSEFDKIEKICREHITEFNLDGLNSTPKKCIIELKNELNNIENEKKQIKSDLNIYSKNQLSNLYVLHEQIKLERIRKEISNNFSKTNYTYIIDGWVLEKNVNELENTVSNISENNIIFNFKEPSINPDDPPTHIEIPKWAGSFKTLLELFGTPKYNEINPTIIMGIFFILFFGVMLGDAGYGLIILILSLFFYYKFSKFKSMLKDLSFMGIWIGLTTTIVGILTNSFFGDFIQRFIFNDLSKLFYSFEIFGINFPVEPIRDPLSILIVALTLGLIHMNLGILLALYQSYRNKKYKELFTKHFTWIILQIGGGGLIGALLLHIWELNTIQFYLFSIMVILGLLLIIIDSGPLGLFGITGYIGDWLSYARLLALGLGTTGMALAFNVVAEIVPNMIPYIGIVFVPIILIVTHTANLGIQALGAGVHSLRLQYVEFFNRFYEGGGKDFKPFSTKRKFTKIIEYE
ncbi:MAG: V-type ATP synthase subunit I [Candidatus Thermoplasmatota archaeon]|nr:V-type ATP synthase subunit I [Candidatus Thermoplasmatota archaeon]